ncbi:hypothetical protein JB92DRAFT_2830727 [Gautieria morchelliformis]|nr:hypothetical protein JB92DRAFT_2830727 [Gautieria morchelliformis]
MAKLSSGADAKLWTWTPNPISDEQAFRAIKAGVDAAGDAKVLLNSRKTLENQMLQGNSGHGLTTANLELLARFYQKEDWNPTAIHPSRLNSTAGELQIFKSAYSPLRRGLLKVKSPDNIPDGDIRRHTERFYPENFHKNRNRQLVNYLANNAQHYQHCMGAVTRATHHDTIAWFFKVQF